MDPKRSKSFRKTVENYGRVARKFGTCDRGGGWRREMDTHPIYVAEKERENRGRGISVRVRVRVCVHRSILTKLHYDPQPPFFNHALGIRTREECRHEDGRTVVNYLREIRFVMDDDSLDLLIL